MNYANITKKNLNAPSISHPWSKDTQMERLAVSALDGLWRPNKNGNYMSLLQLQGYTSSNKALRDYTGKSPPKLESFIRARPHLYLVKVVIDRGSTAVNIHRRSEDFRNGLALLIGHIQSNGYASMTEIRKLLNDHGYGGMISQLWHDCTPSVSACVRCSTPFTAEMGAIFEWANYDNRLVATKAGVVDNVVLLNWRERFIAAKLISSLLPLTKTGDASVAQIYEDHGHLRPRVRGISIDVGIEFKADVCGLPAESDLRDYFRVGQQNIIYEARLVLGFQLFHNSYVFSRYWRAVWVAKEANGMIKNSLSKVRQNCTDWMKLVENELEYVFDEQEDEQGSPSSVISGNGYWH